MTVLMLGLTRKRGAVEEGEQVFAERTNVWQSGPVPPKFYSWLFTTRKGWFFKRRGRPIFQISRRDFTTSILWLCWIFQWMLCRRLKRHVFVCQGHSRNFFFLSNSNETVKGYFKAGFLFLSHIGHAPFVEHVGSVQLLSKNKTAMDILTQQVFVFLSFSLFIFVHPYSVIYVFMLLYLYCCYLVFVIPCYTCCTLHSPKWKIDTKKVWLFVPFSQRHLLFTDSPPSSKTYCSLWRLYFFITKT